MNAGHKSPAADVGAHGQPGHPAPDDEVEAHTTALTHSELKSPTKAWPFSAWLMLESVNHEAPWPNSLGMNVCRRKAPTGRATRKARMAQTSPWPAVMAGYVLDPGKQGRGRGRRPALSGASPLPGGPPARTSPVGAGPGAMVSRVAGYVEVNSTGPARTDVQFSRVFNDVARVIQ